MRKAHGFRWPAALIVLAGISLGTARSENGQLDPSQRAAVRQMLDSIRDTVKFRYYDSHFHGVNLDARAEAAKDRLPHVATLSDAYGLAAWMLEPLDDSHTLFLPPARPYRIENGWRINFVADRCYITAVQPGSDAEAQGLKPGDQLLAMEGFRLERNSAWQLQYAFETLAPRSGMHLVVAAPNSAPRELLVRANVQRLPRLLTVDLEQRDRQDLRTQKPQLAELDGKLLVWKLPTFEAGNHELEQFFATAVKHDALILDLRGSSGASESTLTRLLGAVMGHEVRVGDRIGRKESRPLIAKPWPSEKRFSGKMIVLIDSASASYAEIFARVMQIESRATVIGDRSSGRVLQTAVYDDRAGSVSFSIPFGVQVSVSDLILADGRSLEHTGVAPDEKLLPTVEDLAAGRDPVLSKAARLCGVDLPAGKAAALFPTIWHP